jgi:hypothetical protein
MKGKESLVSMCGRLRKVSLPPALTLVEMKGKESLVSMCGRLRKVSTPSSSHLSGVEGEGVPGEHVWQVEEGLHSLQLSP